MMAQSTEDQTAKQMVNQMKSDIEGHLQLLNSRLNYLSDNNQLNSKQQ
jgi:rubrerythrin